MRFGKRSRLTNPKGVACDVESYVYLPFLEETGYLPKDRFSCGPEIREHIDRVMSKWNLSSHAYLQTKVNSIVWDEALRRWHVRTSRGDHFTAQFVITATGTLHEPKFPGIPGIDDFQNAKFHSGRWDYSVTGGDGTGNMDKLADKTVGIIGTGASAAQIVPMLARSAKKLFDFQRTPSTISLRGNRKTDPSMAVTLKPGWQQGRMELLGNILSGDMTDAECTALEGLEILSPRAIYQEAAKAGVTVQPEDIPELMQLADMRRMEGVRKLIEDTVKDKATAEKLKPWYSFMCKRPACHNDYLATFNNPNVELVDTDGRGVSRLTQTAVVANGQEYRVDVLIFATGFDFFIRPDFYNRCGFSLVGSSGASLDEVWEKNGPSTLFGIHFGGFPNLFNIGAVQAGVGVTWLHTCYVAADHIACVITSSLKEGRFGVIEPTEESQEEWGKQMDEGEEMKLQFLKSCSPGYFNNEGKPEEFSARWGVYLKGVMVWAKALKEWREAGKLRMKTR